MNICIYFTIKNFKLIYVTFTYNTNTHDYKLILSYKS